MNFSGVESFPFRVLHFSASFQQQHFQNFTCFFLGSGKLRGRQFHAKISHLARNCEFGSPFWGPVSETVTRTQRLLREVPVSLGIVENLEIAHPAMLGQVVVEAEIFPRILHCLKAPTADFGG